MFWNKKEKRKYTYASYLKSYFDAQEELKKLNDDILSGQLELVKETNIYEENRLKEENRTLEEVEKERRLKIDKALEEYYKGFAGSSDLVYRETKPITLWDITTGATGEITAEDMNIKGNKEKVPYYNRYPYETIEMMCDVFGDEDTATFCLVNAYKYRMRMGLKDCMKEDLKKEQWYLDKYKELTVEK